MKMRIKNLLGFFLIIASVLLLTASVSASELASIDKVTVNGLTVYRDSDTCVKNVSVVAGETITVKVYFTALENDTDVRVEAELEGDKVDVDAVSEVFDMEKGYEYPPKVLKLKVPYELKDDVRDDLTLVIKIDGAEHKTKLEDIIIRVQRPSYNVNIMSINMPQSVEAGDTFLVNVVLKNIGYNDLDDLYVTAGIPALDLEEGVYVGDLIAVENGNNDNDEDTLSMKLYLRIPYDAVSGIYALEVEATNEDLSVSAVEQIVIKNDFSSNVIATEHRKTFSVGENGEYSLLIVNPTNKVKVYRVVPESTGSLSVRASESVVAVPAGSSKTVKIFARADARGEYQFDVNVFSGEELVGTTRLSANVEGAAVQNAVVVLTIVLGIIFVVLLIVLIVLLRKKPEKAEEFGESYY